MWPIAMPLVGAVFEVFQKNYKTIAQEVGTSSQVVEHVGNVLERYASKDDKLLEMAMKEMELARQHDIQTQVKDIPLVSLLRGLVRPSVTFAAMGWYIYASVKHIPLQAEDFAIIGGVLAFWFGVRPFEKLKKG